MLCEVLSISLVYRYFSSSNLRGGNYDFDVEGSVDFEKSRRLFLKMREGEISPDEHNQLKQQLKRQRDIIPILVVGFHALLSIFLLFAFVATAELFTPTESVEMLGFSFLVIGVYNSFMLLHTRFGLRERFLGSFERCLSS